ncbi:hypothetical protein JEZ13_09565 [bacterium]|nr:hypothetical protein [bacterium]
MKKIIIMMLVLMTVGILSAATVGVEADTQVKNLGYRPFNSPPGTQFEPGDGPNYFRISLYHQLGVYEISFEYFDQNWGFWREHRDVVAIWWLETELRLYYQLVTGNPPTDPGNQ